MVMGGGPGVVRPQGFAGQYLPKDMVFKVPEDLTMWVKRPAGHYYLPLMSTFRRASPSTSCAIRPPA
jgi:hypothetical protein